MLHLACYTLQLSEPLRFLYPSQQLQCHRLVRFVSVGICRASYRFLPVLLRQLIISQLSRRQPCPE
jgi:hypothetical protein